MFGADFKRVEIAEDAKLDWTDKKLFICLRLSCNMVKIGKKYKNMLVVDQKKTALQDLYGYLSWEWDPRRIEWSLRMTMTLLMSPGANVSK